MSGPVNPDVSLVGAIGWLRERIRDGADCPCCGQFAKIYKRKLNSQQARTLILIYKSAGMEWCHVTTVHPTLAGNGGDISKLRYWGLVEESTEKRVDGGRAGWWRITERGARFVEETVGVQQYALVYNGKCLNLEGPNITIRDALGDKFDYQELMYS